MALDGGITALSARILADQGFRASLGAKPFAFQIRVTDQNRVWNFKCADPSPSVQAREGDFSVELSATAQVFELLFDGTLNPQLAWFQKRLMLRGDLEAALPLFRIFGPLS